MARKTVTVKADPDDDKHKTPLEVEVPEAPEPEKRTVALDYFTRVNPENGLEAVFAPGDEVPEWARTEAVEA
jgi:hypothetical protein